jgi:hypothetical protein
MAVAAKAFGDETLFASLHGFASKVDHECVRNGERRAAQRRISGAQALAAVMLIGFLPPRRTVL